MGWEVNFFLEEVQFFLGGYILKLSFSHDKALPFILQLRRTKLQYKIIFEEDPVPIAIAIVRSNIIFILFKYVFS